MSDRPARIEIDGQDLRECDQIHAGPISGARKSRPADASERIRAGHLNAFHRTAA
jgi:hypothetical protein